MVTITMTLTDVTGTPVTPAQQITFPAMVVYGKDYHKTRIGQKTVRTLDGVQHTFDRGVTVCYGELSIKGMEISDKEALESFIIDSMNFNENYFTISTTPCSTTGRDLDLGNGFGVPIGVCKFSENFTSTSGVFKFKAPGLYSVVLPYTYAL